MVLVNANFSQFFSAAETSLYNARNHPEIAAALAAYGYTDEVLQEGQTLLDEARTLYDAQIREYGEQYAATETFYEAFRQADKRYAHHRALAKIAFKKDPQRQTNFLLHQRRPDLFDPWYDQALHFYTAILADEEAINKLARYQITAEVLQNALDEVEHIHELKSIQEQEIGEARRSTQERNAAINALAEWLSDFKVVARIALDDAPQLFETLKLDEIP